MSFKTSAEIREEARDEVGVVTCRCYTSPLDGFQLCANCEGAMIHEAELADAGCFEDGVVEADPYGGEWDYWHAQWD